MGDKLAWDIAGHAEAGLKSFKVIIASINNFINYNTKLLKAFIAWSADVNY
jgi:hypothetical protein